LLIFKINFFKIFLSLIEILKIYYKIQELI